MLSWEDTTLTDVHQGQRLARMDSDVTPSSSVLLLTTVDSHETEEHSDAPSGHYGRLTRIPEPDREHPGS
jgi:hypothetical protein